MRFTVLLLPDRDQGGYVAHVPALPGCVTQGETVDEAVAMARDAATLLLEVMSEAGEELPDEPPGAVVTSIELPDVLLASA